MNLDQAKSLFFNLFFNELDARHIPYCILFDHQNYPEKIESDVDFMVSTADREKIAPVINQIAKATGSYFVTSSSHETTASAYFIAFVEGSALHFLQLDCSQDLRWKGRLWLRASDILERRVKSAKGFYVAADIDAFEYYLVKKIEKSEISPKQLNALSLLYLKNRDACEKKLNLYWSGQNLTLLKSLLGGNEGTLGLQGFNALKKEYYQRNQKENFFSKTKQFYSEALRLFTRLHEPTGFCIAMMGPDGSGKSTIIRHVQKIFSPLFRNRQYYFHLRPDLVRRSTSPTPTSDPHAKNPYILPVSLIKVLYFFFLYNIGYRLNILPKLIFTSLVIFDRYYHDILVDPVRYRLSNVKTVATLVSFLIPKPEFWLLMDAPESVIHPRKSEVSLEECGRQRRAYLELFKTIKTSAVIDTGQDVEKSLSQVNHAISLALQNRNLKRLGLT